MMTCSGLVDKRPFGTHLATDAAAHELAHEGVHLRRLSAGPLLRSAVDLAVPHDAPFVQRRRRSRRVVPGALFFHINYFLPVSKAVGAGVSRVCTDRCNGGGGLRGATGTKVVRRRRCGRCGRWCRLCNYGAVSVLVQGIQEKAQKLVGVLNSISWKLTAWKEKKEREHIKPVACD